MRASEFAKAIVGGVVAGLGALVTAIADESMTVTEWVVVALATVSGFGAVFNTPNAEPLVSHRGRGRRPEVGQSNVLYILACVLIAVLVVFVMFQLFGRSR